MKNPSTNFGQIADKIQTELYPWSGYELAPKRAKGKGGFPEEEKRYLPLVVKETTSFFENLVDPLLKFNCLLNHAIHGRYKEETRLK